MKKKLLFLSAFLIIFICSKAQLIKTDKGIILKNFGSSTHTLKLEVINSNIIHLIASPTADYSNDYLTSTINSEDPKFSIKICLGSILIKTDTMQIIIDSNNGKVTFKDKENNLLLQENNRLYKKNLKLSWSIKQEFRWSPDESLYNFGQTNEKISNIRGKQLDLLQQNTSNYPLISSSKGYGILWFNNSHSIFCDINDNSYLWSEKANQVDYYFLYAPSAEELIACCRKLTSELAVLSNDVWGYTQSKDSKGVQVEESNMSNQKLKKF